jgi:hypothetical protein
MLHPRVAAIGCLLLSTLLLSAQRLDPGGSRLRALALLELASNGQASLMPIAIKVADKYYDASVYRADPYPLALSQNTVYEAERAGESVGLFTVTRVHQMKDYWVGLGRWQTNRELRPPDKNVRSDRPDRPPGPADERPVLRKAKPSPDSPNPASTAGPQLKPETPPPDSDPDRPLLRRAQPVSPPTSSEPSPPTPAPLANARGQATSSFPKVELLAAISDAGGPPPHSYVLPLKGADRDRYQLRMCQMAYDAIRKFAAARPQHKPADPAALTNVQFRAYNVLSSHEPDLVLTASLPELLPRGATSDFRYFVTLTARVDMYGETRPLFAEVTDSTRLDASPRMELIDVVDAEGSGSGQLLFRRVSDTGYSFVLYRIGLDKLWPLFEGAERSF